MSPDLPPILSTHVSWIAQADQAWKEHVTELAKASDDYEEMTAGVHAGIGPVIVEREGTRRQSSLMAHWRHEDEAGRIFLSCLNSPAPGDDELPNWVAERTHRVGGADGFLELILAASNDGASTIATYLVTLELPYDTWQHAKVPQRVGPDSADAGVLELAQGVFTEQAGYRFESGVGGLLQATIVFRHEDPQHYDVEVVGRSKLEFDSDLWPTPASKLAELLVTHSFSKVGSQENAQAKAAD